MSWLDYLAIDVREGDLFEAEVEATVCSFRVNGHLYGKSSLGLLERCGVALQQEIGECMRRKADHSLPLGGTISIDASKFAATRRFKRIIFAALWAERENEYNANLVYRLMSNSFREAEKYRLSAIAIPVLKLNNDQHKDQIIYAKTVVKVIEDFNNLKNSDQFPVQEMLFISNKKAKVEMLRNYLDRYLP